MAEISYDRISKELEAEYKDFLKFQGLTKTDWPFGFFLENIIEFSDDGERVNVARTMIKTPSGNELKTRLEREYNFEDHPKRDILFELAWERKHHDGEHAVRAEYVALSALLD